MLQEMNRSNNGGKEIKIYINSSFTAEPLEQCLKHLGNYFKYDLSVSFTPVNQVLQEMMQVQNTYDVYIILFRIEDLLFDSTYVSEKDEDNLNQFITTFLEVVKEFSESRNVVIPVFPVSDFFEPKCKEKLQQVTAFCANSLKKIPHIHVPDLADLANIYGLKEPYDRVAYKEAWIPFQEEYFNLLGLSIFRYVLGSINNPFKLILVDCDNTLWKGVCGEEGALGVKVDEPFRQLQQILLKKSREGFLLGIVSKNNEHDAWEVFEKNEGMVLKKTDFIAWKINWTNKSENIRNLVSELNLGLESVIFIDDDIKECSEVMEGCPQVFTLPLPDNTGAIRDFIEWNWAFDKFKITQEDLIRTESYKSEHLRAIEQVKAKSIKEFLEGLNIHVSFRQATVTEIPRLSQLTYRTNQFNLSTIRRTEQEMETLFSDARHSCWTVEVSDKFSAFGIVGLLITTIEENKLLIETFLLSCRALGRGVEDIILAALKRYCAEYSLSELQANFFPTAKNQPILNFLEKRWIKAKQTDYGTNYTLNITDIEEEQYPGTLHYNDPLKHEKKVGENPVHRIVELNDNGGYATIKQFWHNPLRTDLLAHKNYYLPLELQDHIEVSKFFKQKNDNSEIRESNSLSSQIEMILTEFPGVTRISAIQNNGELSIYYTAVQNISTLKLRKFLNEKIQIAFSLSFIQVHNPNDWPAQLNQSETRSTADHRSSTHTKFESVVIKVWQEVLEGKEVSINDNFFDIGGNSFQVVKVISRLENRYNIKPSFKDFFNNTLKQFCSNLSKEFGEEIAKIE